MDRNCVHRASDVLHLGASRTALLRPHPPHGRVRHQPYDPPSGPGDRLVRRAFGPRLRQVPRDGSHARCGAPCRCADRRGVAREHRVPRAADSAPRIARPFSRRGGRRAGLGRADPATGRFALERAEPIVYSHGTYFALGEALGNFGWSVRKRPSVQARKRSGR